MMDLATVSFVCSIVLCILSICTFITGMTSRSKQDGQVIAKLDHAVKAIEEMKADSKSAANDVKKLSEDMIAVKVRISALDDRVSKLENGGAIPV